MKYRVIYQFNDKEMLESRMPGDIIELSEERAKEILEVGPFIEKVDEKSEDPLSDEEEADEKSEDSSPDEEKTSTKSQSRKTSAKAKAVKSVN